MSISLKYTSFTSRSLALKLLSAAQEVKATGDVVQASTIPSVMKERGATHIVKLWDGAGVTGSGFIGSAFIVLERP